MLPKTILRGYDRVTEKIIARALGIPLKPRKKKGRGGMKIPVRALKSAPKEKLQEKKKGIKVSALRSKKKMNDNDGDE